ncbi:MAG TPA: SH3 domain-containing protein [Thermomicrobiales bacterium]|nr:SH3 domain-containing protein [Thermomicrobiales bacterium]
MNRRSRHTNRNPLMSAMTTLGIAALGLVVLWQLGHGFVTDDAASTGDLQTDAAFVTTSEVNLREGPGIDHEVLAVLPIKTKVEVTGDPRDGFAPVRTEGRQAWVSVDYIAPEGSVLASTEHIPLVAMPVEEPEPTVEPTPMPTEAPVQQTIAESVEIPAVEVDARVPSGERWIEIDRVEKTVTLHHGDTIVGVYDALIGKDLSASGYYSTAIGTYHVFMMNRALTETPFAPGMYLTDFVGFDPARSNGIHSPVRDADGDVIVTGGTETLGCVRLSADDARTVFDFAELGMRVEVHD